jgi:hypothetical protein
LQRDCIGRGQCHERPHVTPNIHVRESNGVRGLLKCQGARQVLLPPGQELKSHNAYIRRLDIRPQRRILAPTRSGSQVTQTRPDPQRTDEFGQVLAFRRRPGPSPVSSDPPSEGEAGLADDLAQYEQDQDAPIDYRQRMLMNVIAIAIVTLLVGAGVWIADTIADIEKDQDCVLQGRANCAPIETPVPNRE